MDENLTVEYQLEPGDYLAFAEEQRLRFSSDSLSRLYYYGVVPALGTGLAVATQSFGIASIFTLLYISSGWLVQKSAWRNYRRAVYSDDNISFGARRWRATLTDEGVSVSSDAATALYRWAFIREVSRSPRFLLFVITPLYRVRIPTRAFRDDEHVQKFTLAAQSHGKNPPEAVREASASGQKSPPA